MPFENPNGLSNFLELLLILIIPAGLTATFGRMVGSRRQGWALYAAMFVLFVVGVAIVYAAEAHGSVAQHAAGHRRAATSRARRRASAIANSALWTAITTVTSCGAVNAALDSLTGIGGAIPMSNMMLGEVVFGGVGSGLYGMLLFVLLAVFIAGLMVGRTPEYLGKKIEAREVKLVMIGTLAMPLLVLFAVRARDGDEVRRAVAVQRRPAGLLRARSTPTPRRRTTTARRSPATPASCSPTRRATPARSASPTPTSSAAWRCSSGASCRCSPRSPSPGRWSRKRVAPLGPGTMRTDTPIFVVLLIGVILLVALLTFVPALLLGPVVQGLTTQLF